MKTISDIIQCTILPTSEQSRHSLIYAGFTSLHKQGLINLKQQCLTQNSSSISHLIFAAVNNDIKLCYDTGDDNKICDEHINNVDFYFKRSYSPILHDHFGDRVRPLGLNYEVYNDSFDIYELKRKLVYRTGIKPRLKSFVSSCIHNNQIIGSPLFFKPTLANMYSPPTRQPPKVIFMVRAWDPAEKESNDKKQERIYINEMRARCIELMRKEFGKHFTGGFKHTKYAMSNHKNVLLDDDCHSKKANYIRLLKDHSICIATTGLHGSIGWKLAEYVALSKAIVSERLNYFVPGNFSKDVNYLEFETAEQCTEEAVKLFTDEDQRFQIMENNNRYYHNYLRPDVLVHNTLKIAMNEQD